MDRASMHADDGRFSSDTLFAERSSQCVGKFLLVLDQQKSQDLRSSFWTAKKTGLLAA
jgi:hypothetical protein